MVAGLQQLSAAPVVNSCNERWRLRHGTPKTTANTYHFIFWSRVITTYSWSPWAHHPRRVVRNEARGDLVRSRASSVSDPGGGDGVILGGHRSCREALIYRMKRNSMLVPPKWKAPCDCAQVPKTHRTRRGAVILLKPTLILCRARASPLEDF